MYNTHYFEYMKITCPISENKPPFWWSYHFTLNKLIFNSYTIVWTCNHFWPLFQLTKILLKTLNSENMIMSSYKFSEQTLFCTSCNTNTTTFRSELWKHWKVDTGIWYFICATISFKLHVTLLHIPYFILITSVISMWAWRHACYVIYSSIHENGLWFQYKKIN